MIKFQLFKLNEIGQRFVVCDPESPTQPLDLFDEIEEAHDYANNHPELFSNKRYAVAPVGIIKEELEVKAEGETSELNGSQVAAT